MVQFLFSVFLNCGKNPFLAQNIAYTKNVIDNQVENQANYQWKQTKSYTIIDKIAADLHSDNFVQKNCICNILAHFLYNKK